MGKYIVIKDKNGASIPIKSEVQVTPELSNGVKIATLVDVDGVDHDIYAPMPDNVNLVVNGLTAFANVAALKAATGLQAGDTVMTRGYYESNDGGGSMFRIISSSSYSDSTWTQAFGTNSTPYLDDATLIALQGGLYADLIVPSNGEVNFKQLGAKKMYLSSKVINSKKYYYVHQYDCKEYMMKWLAFNDRKKTTYTLYIPEGVYSFSETWLLRSTNNASAMGIRIHGESPQNSGGGGTILIPHYQAQKYILRVGYRTNDISYTGDVDGMAMRSVTLKDLSFGTTKWAWQGDGFTFQGLNFSTDTTSFATDDDATADSSLSRYVTKAALWLDSSPYGQFDGLYFSSVSGTCMYLTQCYESHFGYTNVRGCGRMTAAGYTYPLIYINAPGPSDVSACYFYYFNFEGCTGDYFYSKTANFTHNEFNNIQIEGSVTVSLPTIRYTKDGNTPIAVDNATTGQKKSPVYSSSLTLPTTLTTYKARAFSGTTATSGTSTVIYDPEISVFPPAIKIKHDGVKMYCATEGATIYYTTDGTTPTSASTQYTGKITSPDSNVTFKAIAILNGESSNVSTTPYKAGLETQAPEIVVKPTGVVMRVVNKGNSKYAAIDKQSASLKYDTDPDYVAPTFTEDGETSAVFGKWIKWFVFTGNMGSSPNYLNSISTSNFGNGFKKYRTYRISNGNILDMDGNTITDSSKYILDNGIYYAVNSDGNKIVDYYRYYALFGEDENNPRDLQQVSGVTRFGSFVWNIGAIYLYKLPGMTSYCGPWVIYSRLSPITFNLTLNQVFDKSEYPYYFEGLRKGKIAKESCAISGAVPFFDLIKNDGSQTMVYTFEGTCAPNGLCIQWKNNFSFFIAHNKTYYIRAYCTPEAYNALYNAGSKYQKNGHPAFYWKGLIGTGGANGSDDAQPYAGNDYVEIPHYGWITIPLPDLGLTEITKVFISGYSGYSDSNAANFLRKLYLDVLLS